MISRKLIFKTIYLWYRVYYIEMSVFKWFWGVKVKKFCWSFFEGMFSSRGHLTFDPYISYKCQRLASTASKREGAKYHRKIGFLMINPTKRGCQGGWGQENHSVSKALTFLRSKRLLRSSCFQRKINKIIDPFTFRHFNVRHPVSKTSHFQKETLSSLNFDRILPRAVLCAFLLPVDFIVYVPLRIQNWAQWTSFNPRKRAIFLALSYILPCHSQ